MKIRVMSCKICGSIIYLRAFSVGHEAEMLEIDRVDLHMKWHGKTSLLSRYLRSLFGIDRS
jgi:hypothetical protein